MPALLLATLQRCGLFMVCGLLPLLSWGQTVTYQCHQTPITTVFAAVEQQTGYVFFYKQSDLELARPVTIRAVGQPFHDFLDRLFAGQPFLYSIKSKSVIVRLKPSPVSPAHGAKDTLQGKHLHVDTLAAVNLSSVTVLSDGFRQIPRERAAGSFELVDPALLNRGSTSSSILDRLNGTVSSLVFDERMLNKTEGSRAPNIYPYFTIRGISTYQSNSVPLVVLDQFPYAGDLNDINPNDIESVTLLRDASAASIWGTRAGNGVMVITTKKGRAGKLHTGFQTNVTYTQKPDLFKYPQMSPADAVDLQLRQYEAGDFNLFLAPPLIAQTMPYTSVIQYLNSTQPPLGVNDPSVQAFKQHDVRSDYEKYVYRNSLSSQHFAYLSGGNDKVQFYASAGVDQRVATIYNNDDTRYTFNSNNSFQLTKNLKAGLGLQYLRHDFNVGGQGYLTDNNSYPFARLTGTLNQVNDFLLDSAKAYGLLDWNYRPLDELKMADHHFFVHAVTLRPSLEYTLLPGLKASIYYSFYQRSQRERVYHSLPSYYTRNLINTLTQASTSTRVPVASPVPHNGILDQNDTSLYNNDWRVQVNYNHNFGPQHQVSFLAGYMRTENTQHMHDYRLYNYDGRQALPADINYTTNYAIFLPTLGRTNAGGAMKVPPSPNVKETVFTALISYYANAGYLFNNRYQFTASARADASNVFGFTTNNRRKPQWSTGVAWYANEEQFYHVKWLPRLSLRATIGIQGNLDPQQTAATLLQYSIAGDSVRQATITARSNPDLRWEKVKQWNIGLDFGTQRDILYGSVEVYRKHATDLIMSYVDDPTTGYSAVTANAGALRAKGMDIHLQSVVMQRGLHWKINAYLNYSLAEMVQVPPSLLNSNSTIIQSEPPLGRGTNFTNTDYRNTRTGEALYPIHSLKWGGLDPATGDPMGYDAQGRLSKNYADLINNPAPSSLIYHGSSTPLYVAGLMQDLGLGRFTLLVNIVMRAGYYFRQPGVDYGALLTYMGYLNDNQLGMAEISHRWRNPGDEKHTQVPSIPTNPGTALYRSLFYLYSSEKVSRGDNVRLQNIQVAYDVGKRFRVYANRQMNKLLWKASKGIDPDFPYLLPPVQTTLGITGNF